MPTENRLDIVLWRDGPMMDHWVLLWRTQEVREDFRTR
jgi:hypothetical protein